MKKCSKFPLEQQVTIIDLHKILITFKNECIIFSKYEKDVKNVNLENTNVIDISELKFSVDYILNNFDMLSTFLSVSCLKNNINVAIIKNVEIAQTILKLISSIGIIKKIVFTQDIELNNSISSLYQM